MAVQATIKEAADFLNYSPRTIRRMLERGVLPFTGKGALLRIPWSAIHAKLARMQEGESLWEPDKPAAKKAPEASGRTSTVKRGTPIKTSTKKSTVIARVRSEPPKWR
jgi:excisionase family DNA binding protein